MRKLNKLILILVLVCLPILISCKHKNTHSRNTLVILSLDGFRWDYPILYDTPNLDKLAAIGVKAEAIVPSFPSNTFPNHYTMVTGLYPDHHGLVNNTFFDPERRDTFMLRKRQMVEDGYYYGGEPVWETAQKQGLKSAAFFWVGSEAEINGSRPDIWKSFNSDIPYGDRMDSVISWLELPKEKRPDLITWYIEEPDKISHDYGPISPETEAMVYHLDSLVGVFMKKINDLPGKENINVIITSDHGIGEANGDMWINIKDFIREDQLDYILGYNPLIFIQPKEIYTDSVINSLLQVDHIKVWKKDEIPGRFHYGSNSRISELIVLADSGWSIGTKPGKGSGIFGAHGYDNQNTDMHAIFYAYGPDFKKNYIQEKFDNIDLYPLFCELLKIEMAPSDGQLTKVKSMMINR